MKERLIPVPEEKGLYYDIKTLVVYYGEKTLVEYHWTFTALTPYLGEHGRACRYMYGDIVEIRE